MFPGSALILVRHRCIFESVAKVNSRFWAHSQTQLSSVRRLCLAQKTRFSPLFSNSCSAFQFLPERMVLDQNPEMREWRSANSFLPLQGGGLRWRSSSYPESIISRWDHVRR